MCLHPHCQTDPLSPSCANTWDENFSGELLCPKFNPARFVLLWLQPAVKGLGGILADFVLNKLHPVSKGCSSLNQEEFCAFLDDSVTLGCREKEQNLCCARILSAFPLLSQLPSKPPSATGIIWLLWYLARVAGLLSAATLRVLGWVNSIS